jgi:hypothetical protein
MYDLARGGRSASVLETDDRGRFSEACQPGEAVVAAWDKESWASERVQVGVPGDTSKDIVLRLQPGRTIKGIAHYQDGSPAAGIKILFGCEPTGISDIVESAKDGTFSIGGLPPEDVITIFTVEDPGPVYKRKQTVGRSQSFVDLLVVHKEK